MGEQKSQARYIPLRVRLRASNKTIATLGDSLRRREPIVLGLSNVLGTGRHIQQIKELVRLGNLLRADQGLDGVLQQIVASAVACTGFRLLVIRLWDEETKQLAMVACNNVAEESPDMLGAAPVSWEALQRLMQPEFRLSQSYFIAHGRAALDADKPLTSSKPVDEHEGGAWHPDDLFFVPFYSPREHKLLGMISLDDPVDGKVPTVENIEIVQLFVGMAATAIDNVLLLQERELDNIHMVVRAIDEHMDNVQRQTEKLLHDINRQEMQIKHISQIMSETANTMHHITENAAMLARTASEAVYAAIDAQDAVDGAVKGMMDVRDSTLRSSGTMKELLESGQEINGLALAPTELTTRLHFLALNAAIEAIHVGEQGQGFALIAQELRSLATSSKESARKIEGFIRSTQHETEVVSQSIEESAQHIIMQTELLTQAGTALDSVNSMTEQLPDLVQNICVVAENQSQGSQMAANALDEIFRTKANITGHIQAVQQSMTHLADLTNALRSRMALLRSQEH